MKLGDSPLAFVPEGIASLLVRILGFLAICGTSLLLSRAVFEWQWEWTNLFEYLLWTFFSPLFACFTVPLLAWWGFLLPGTLFVLFVYHVHQEKPWSVTAPPMVLVPSLAVFLIHRSEGGPLGVREWVFGLLWALLLFAWAPWLVLGRRKTRVREPLIR